MNSKIAVFSILAVLEMPSPSSGQVTHLDSPNGGPANVVAADANGNVSILQNLSVARNVDAGYLLLEPQGPSDGGGFRLLGGEGNPTWYVQSRYAALHLATNVDAPQFSISQNGNVGIGTPSPESLLQLGEVPRKNNLNAISIFGGWSEPDSPSHSAPGDKIVVNRVAPWKTAIGQGANNDLWFQTTVPDGRNASAYRFFVGLGAGAAPVEKFTIKDTGFVGIGITSPEMALHVNGDFR